MNNHNFDIDKSTDVERDQLVDKLVYFNRTSLGLDPSIYPGIPLNYIIKEDGAIIAGINAELYYLNVLHIKILFVDEKYRLHQLGSTLLKKVEDEAKAQGAEIAHLDTFEFQARDFYIKQGYEIYGVLENCPRGHNRYYFKKVL
jgi:GNAT superfamily N-acetyltransferase